MKRDHKTKTLLARRYQTRFLGFLSVLAMSVPYVCSGQGNLTFGGVVGLYGTNYYEQGMWFRVVIPTRGPGSPSNDSMGIAPAVTTPSNIPYNDTPYMVFFRQFSPDNYVLFSLTSGSPFGLVSVQLADPSSPSYSLLPITFVGFQADGSTVSQTFTTPGGGANSFLTYHFGPEFASGLLSVKIDAARWAMDNLVWVPEPGTYALLGLGVLALGIRKSIRRRKL